MNLWFIICIATSRFQISRSLTVLHNGFAFQHLRWVEVMCVYCRFTSGIHLPVLFFRWLRLNYQPPESFNFFFSHSLCFLAVRFSLSDPFSHVFKFCSLLKRCPAVAGQRFQYWYVNKQTGADGRWRCSAEVYWQCYGGKMLERSPTCSELYGL